MAQTPVKKAVRSIAEKRLPGRPSSQAEGVSGRPSLSAEHIIDAAFELCREIPLADVSIVQLAKELKVTPASLHYYLDGRDGLVAGVISKYFERMLPCFELGIGESWEVRVRAVARALYDFQVQYKGLTSYFISHNKFRLIQSDAPAKADFGIRYLDSMLKLFLDRPFSVEEAVANSHHLVRFIGASAHSAGGRQLPGQHAKFIREQLLKTEPTEFPSVHKAIDVFTSFGAEEAFETGLSILIRGFEVQMLPSTPRKKILTKLLKPNGRQLRN